MRGLDVVVAQLEASGLGTGGIDIFAGADADLPENPPHRFLTLAETAGRGSVGSHNSGTLRQPAVQVAARGDNPDDVITLAAAAHLALGGETTIANRQVGDTFILWMHPEQEPFGQPNDAVGRNRRAFNVAMLIRVLPGDAPVPPVSWIQGGWVQP